MCKKIEELCGRQNQIRRMKIIEKYCMPQKRNAVDKCDPERNIEVHIWSDETIHIYVKDFNLTI